MCAALAIFRCQPSSHPFQERHIPLVEAVKIGRSVARARPATNNGIFDCKVLSRNHAILSYDGGKFYLQDTKSSNGTFINNQRLSKGADDSPASEIFSGDLIQFGVDVMENNRRGEKVTHGCIICTVSLFHPDGQEAKHAENLSSIGSSIQCQELYQLAQYLQEALHREQMLEQKLKSLQKLIEDTQLSSESGWQALIDEDRLLSRLEVLESQLHAYSKNHTEDTLRQELVALQEDKRNYETTAKESLRRVLQEKLDAVHKLTDLERSLTDTESECSHLKANCESCQEELEKLAEKHEAQLSEVNQLGEKLQVAEDDHEEALQRAAEERQEVNLQIEEKLKQEASLTAKIEALQADNDFTQKQLTAMKAKLEVLKEKKDDDAEDKDSSKDDGSDNENKDDIDIQIKLDDHQVPHVEIIPLKPIRKQEKESDLEGKLKEVQKQIEEYKGRLQETEGSLKESSDQVEELQKKLEEAKLDSNQYITEISALEERLKLSDYQMNHILEHAQDDLWLQLKESSKQNMNSACLLQQLKDRIVELEDDDETVCESNGLQGEIIMESLKSNVTLVSNYTESTSPGTQKTEGDNLQALLLESADKCHKLESDLERVKDAYNESVKLADRKSDLIHNLQGELEKTKAVQHKYEQDLEETKRQLLQTQQAAKQSSNEAEQVRNKLKMLQQELDRENTASTDSNRQAVRAKEFAALKEECANLRKRIQAIEAEMRMSRKENLQLSSDYNKLQESHQKLEALKLRLEKQDVSWQQKLTNTELQRVLCAPSQLRTANEELTNIAQERSMPSSPISPSPSSPLSSSSLLSSPSLSSSTGHDSSAFIKEDYQQLADKCKFLSLCSSIPLLVLMFSLLLALYPMLAEITGTTAPP